jgi:hypothetical protein
VCGYAASGTPRARLSSAVTDDELTDAWLAGQVFPGGISHQHHVRIAWVLHRRHGPEGAETVLVSGTRHACRVHGCPDKFDEALTRRWSRAVAEAAGRDGLGRSAGAFISAHPELLHGDRFGKPGREFRSSFR